MSAMTEIYLLNVPLDKELNHTLWFGSKSEQTEYFKSKKIANNSGVNGCTYQRKESIIRYPALVDDINSANYVMYRNYSQSTKWYYAFIKNMEYKQEDLTYIEIEIDPIQTYLFDITIGKCFIEREHVTNDEVGAHTIPENLETGEYICNGYKYDTDMLVYSYVINYTETPSGAIAKGAFNMGGIPVAGGIHQYLDYNLLEEFITEFDEAGKSDAIVSVYIVPRKFFKPNIVDGEEVYATSPLDTEEPITYDYEITKPTSLKGYTPRNKKLLTYPYQYLAVSNNSGASNVLQFEHFTDSQGARSNKCIFEVAGIPVIGGSIKSVPKYYKEIVRNNDEGIIAGKFPVLSWSSDYFTNWLTQNSVNIGVQAGSSIASIVGGTALLLTGAGAMAGAGMIAGGLMGVSNQMGQLYEHSLIPASSKGNVNGGDIVTASKANTFFYNSMCIKPEYARVIDKFFDMYGYKVNDLKVPNKNHRSKYWYTKTIDANITGNAPQAELTRIINAYNKGITFWRKDANFRGYEENDIL